MINPINFGTTRPQPLERPGFAEWARKKGKSLPLTTPIKLESHKSNLVRVFRREPDGSITDMGLYKAKQADKMATDKPNAFVFMLPDAQVQQARETFTIH